MISYLLILLVILLICGDVISGLFLWAKSTKISSWTILPTELSPKLSPSSNVVTQGLEGQKVVRKKYQTSGINHQDLKNPFTNIVKNALWC